MYHNNAIGKSSNILSRKQTFNDFNAHLSNLNPNANCFVQTGGKKARNKEEMHSLSLNSNVSNFSPPICYKSPSIFDKTPPAISSDTPNTSLESVEELEVSVLEDTDINDTCSLSIMMAFEEEYVKNDAYNEDG